ncbi:hypothetical protein M899_3013 [Bacteriovorax sp. BSW11_IV]|nr:hypothetical protein M899_3013 [Bacteriovorax sp. BSW11_IV]
MYFSIVVECCVDREIIMRDEDIVPLEMTGFQDILFKKKGDL